MPLYDYKCPRCGVLEVNVPRKIDERHDGPECFHCKKPMDLEVGAVKGVVKNPAVPRGR
jgi:putative FmdB family regulatory protein